MNENNVCANGVTDCGNSPHYTQRPGFRWLPYKQATMGTYSFMGNQQSSVAIGYSYYEDNAASSWWVCYPCAVEIMSYTIDEADELEILG